MLTRGKEFKTRVGTICKTDVWGTSFDGLQNNRVERPLPVTLFFLPGIISSHRKLPSEKKPNLNQIKTKQTKNKQQPNKQTNKQCRFYSWALVKCKSKQSLLPDNRKFRDQSTYSLIKHTKLRQFS